MAELFNPKFVANDKISRLQGIIVSRIANQLRSNAWEDGEALRSHLRISYHITSAVLEKLVELSETCKFFHLESSMEKNKTHNIRESCNIQNTEIMASCTTVQTVTIRSV